MKSLKLAILIVLVVSIGGLAIAADNSLNKSVEVNNNALSSDISVNAASQATQQDESKDNNQLTINKAEGKAELNDSDLNKQQNDLLENNATNKPDEQAKTHGETTHNYKKQHADKTEHENAERDRD